MCRNTFGKSHRSDKGLFIQPFTTLTTFDLDKNIRLVIVVMKAE